MEKIENIDSQGPKSSWIWMKGSAGFPSVTTTFLFISFWVTTISYIISMIQKIGPLDIRPFDVGACSAYFGLILGTYVARRASDAKWGNPNIPPASTPTPGTQK